MSNYPNVPPSTTVTVLPPPPAHAASTSVQPSSGLPFTGGDVAGLAGIGLAACVIGAALWRRARVRHAR